MATPQNGVVSVTVNGDPIFIKGTVSYALGGKVREPVVGPTGLVAFAVKGEAGSIEVVSVDSPEVSIAELQALKDATVTLNLENGKSIVLHDASTVGLIEATTDEGEFTVKFVGPEAEEL